MTSKYLDMLEESLVNKRDLLNTLIALSSQQKTIICSEKVDWDEFDRLVEEKGTLVEKLDSLDDGFEALYDRIRQDVMSNKELYKESILRIQELIREVTDGSTSLMALEQRNKSSLETALLNERKNISQVKKSSQIAANYYKSMSRVNYIDPQLMDKKK